MHGDDQHQTIPLAEEVVRIDRRVMPGDRVRVRTQPGERTEIARAELTTQEVRIERVLLDRFVDHVPEPRQEGDTLIVSIVEEVAVVEKRLLLREEVRLTRVSTTTPFEQRVTLRTTEVIVDRLDPAGPSRNP